jgi:hypothetical protein
MSGNHRLNEATVPGNVSRPTRQCRAGCRARPHSPGPMPGSPVSAFSRSRSRGRGGALRNHRGGGDVARVDQRPAPAPRPPAGRGPHGDAEQIRPSTRQPHRPRHPHQDGTRPGHLERTPEQAVRVERQLGIQLHPLGVHRTPVPPPRHTPRTPSPRPSSAGSSPCRSPVAPSARPTGTRRRPQEPRLPIPTRGTELPWACSAAARAVSRSTTPDTRRPGWRPDPAAASGCGVPSPITRTELAVGRRCPSAAADAACPSRCWSRPALSAACGRCGAGCADDEARSAAADRASRYSAD